MSWKSKIKPLAVLLLLACPLGAQANGISLRVRSSEDSLLGVEPGKIVTWTILVCNDTDRQQEVREQLAVPSGWQRISPPDLPFSLKAKATEVRIVAVLVPHTVRADRFELTYSVKGIHNDTLFDSVKLNARVLAVEKLELIVSDRPEAVIAGESYKVELRLSNRGNSESTVELSVKGNPDYPIEAPRSPLVLKPGQAQDLRITVTTPKTLKRKETHFIQVKTMVAGADGKERPSATQSFAVEVLPRITGETDPFFRIPTQVRLMATQDNGASIGGQIEFSGEVDFDESKNKGLEFLFRGPGQRRANVFGLQDEYRFSYRHKDYDVSLGDRSFSLSPLTRRYGYGRGVEVNLHPGAFELGAFYVKGRWTQSDQRQLGAYVSRNFGQNLRVKLNYLQKTGGHYSFNRDLRQSFYSLETLWKPGEFLDLDLEYGLSRNAAGGTIDRAFRAEAKGILFKRVQYAIEKVSAGQDFYGYYNDVRSAHGSASFALSPRLSANISLVGYDSNLDRNPEKGNFAVREKTYRSGLRYSLKSRTEFSLDYLFLKRRNLLRSEDDFAEQSFRAGIGQGFGRLHLQTFVEKGRGMIPGAPGLARYSFQASYRLGAGQSFTFFARLGDSSYSADPQREQNLGGSASWQFGRNLLLDLQFSRSEYNRYLSRFQDNAYLPNGELNPDYLNNRLGLFEGRNQASVAGSLSYKLPNRHVLSLQGRWWKNSVQGYAENSVYVSYTIPIGVPVKYREGVGRLAGRILESTPGGEKPLDRVVLSLNDATAVTNARGEFIFPSLVPGTYLLRVEQRTIGPNRTTMEPLPRKIEVQEGGSESLDINVVAESSIQVHVSIVPEQTIMLQSTAGSTAPQNIMTSAVAADGTSGEQVDAFEKGLVEVSNGSEIFREFTNRQGIVLFNHLRPGKWTVRMHQNNLPEHHYVENPDTKLVLIPGDQKNVSVKVRQRLRTIRFIDGGTIRPIQR